MPINKALTTTLLFLTASLVSFFSIAQEKKKSRIRPVIPYNHATLNAPPNMVYVRGGSTTIRYNQSSTDTNSIKKVSLTSFFIDKTETTNQQYRQFTEWVIDSIAVMKLRDDYYFMGYTGKEKQEETKPNNDVPNNTPDAAVSDTTHPADSARTAGVTKTQVASNDVPKTKDASMADTSKPFDSTKRRIDWSKVSHRKLFDSKDEETKNKLSSLLDENGEIRRDAYIFTYTYLKTVNTTSNAKDKGKHYVTETLNIYPDEKVWAEDLTNSQTDMLVENYFKISPYDDYPVVGVTWRQARAFAYWRSITAANYTNMPEFMKYYRLTYSLPTEAQWVYAASGYFDMVSSNVADTAANAGPAGDTTLPAATVDSSMTPHDSAYVAAVQAAVENKYNKKVASDSSQKVAEPKAPQGDIVRDSTPIHRDNNGMLANFKQDEGDYWEDGSALTLPVMSFAPNEFGLYNMEGNVSEWVLDAYSPSTFSFVSDLNPALLYDADSTDVDAMRRKVVRGGSFMSNAKALSPYYRDLELDNVAHCYIGFRCVLMAPEVLYRPVGTRRQKMVGHTSTKINQRRSND